MQTVDAVHPYLTADEIAHICSPLVQHAAQVRHLQRLGMRVGRTAGGSPLVARTEFERAMTGGQSTVAAAAASAQQPNREALMAMLGRRGRGA